MAAESTWSAHDEARWMKTVRMARTWYIFMFCWVSLHIDAQFRLISPVNLGRDVSYDKHNLMNSRERTVEISSCESCDELDFGTQFPGFIIV